MSGFSHNPFYDRRHLLKDVVWLVVFCLACKFTKGWAFAVMIPLTLVYLVQGKSVPLFHLMMVGVFSMEINSYFMPKGVFMVASQKIMLMLAAGFLVLQTFGRQHSKVVTPVLWLIPYLVFMGISSQYGWAPIISNLKLFLFVMVFFALYGCAVKVMNDNSDIRTLRETVLSMACFIIVGSILVIPFPSISLMGAEAFESGRLTISLFKGMSWHAQTLGPMVAMLGTLVYADLAFSIQTKEKLYYLLLLCCPILVYKTSSRTAMASLIAGLGFVTFFAMRSRMVNRSWRAKIVSNATMIVIVISASILAVPPLRERVMQYVLKYSHMDDSQSITSEMIWKSREHKLNGAMANWRASPVVGNVFQVTEEMKYIQINGIRDMLSAPVEKSTWTYAILEEGGVIGLVLFCLFVVVALCSLISRGAYIGASLLFVFLVVNFGEFGFFSMSASGGTNWCLVFIGLSLDHKRLRSGWRPLPFFPWR